MKNIISGSYNVRVIEKGKKSKDKKGEYFVRFYNNQLGRYHYINDGDEIEWEEYNCHESKIKIIRKTISSRTNSEKYYISHRVSRNTRPIGNGSIDHFYILENGNIIATQIIGIGYYGISEQEFEDETINF